MRDAVLGFLGSIPDIPMSRIPDFILEKNRVSREEYVAALDFYASGEWEPRGKPFLRVPRTAPPAEVIAWRPFEGGRYEVRRYPSRYEVRNPAVRAAFEEHTANLSGYLHLWRHEPGAAGGAARPLVLCLHGFRMAKPERAERMFRVRKLFGSGLDVGLFTEPHHWRRASGVLRQDLLNPNDVPLTIETLGQCVHDMHAAVLLARSLGAGRIGLIGASLGGFVGALYATVAAAERAVDFLFAVVPAVDLREVLAPRARGFSFPLDAGIVSKTREALRTVTPACHPPRLAVERIFAVYHSADRLCPSRLTRRWIDEWSIPRTNALEIPGGHWLHADRRARGRAWYGWLEKMGYVRGAGP